MKIVIIQEWGVGGYVTVTVTVTQKHVTKRAPMRVIVMQLLLLYQNFHGACMINLYARR